MEKIASIDRGWLRGDRLRHTYIVVNVEKIASIDRGWLPIVPLTWNVAVMGVEKIASIDRGWLHLAFSSQMGNVLCGENSLD